jgi:hypothetical protein
LHRGHPPSQQPLDHLALVRVPVAISSTGKAELGPRWVRAATVAPGHQRSPTVANGSDEPQVVELPAQAAGMLQVGDSDCGPEGRVGDVGAADGQQPVSVTTGEPAREPWRIMTADPPIDSD